MRLMLNTAKYILMGITVTQVRSVGRIFLTEDRSNRFVYIGKDRIVSVACPFKIQMVDGSWNIKFKSELEVTSQMISMLLSISSNDSLLFDTDIYGFLEPFEGNTTDLQAAWRIWAGLISCEDAYLRVDHDPERQHPLYHPLDHIDLFFSNFASLKIGIDSPLTEETLAAFLEGTGPVRFLR